MSWCGIWSRGPRLPELPIRGRPLRRSPGRLFSTLYSCFPETQIAFSHDSASFATAHLEFSTALVRSLRGGALLRRWEGRDVSDGQPGYDSAGIQ